MAINIKGSATAGLANVSNNNQLLVVTPTTEVEAGFSTMSSEVDAGTAPGRTRVVRAAYINDDYQLSTTLDVNLFYEAFVGTAINVFQWFQSTATYTIDVTAGFLRTNAGASTAAGSAVITSYNHIPLVPGNTTFFNFAARTLLGAQANKIIEIGVGFVATNVAATDGAFFRWNGSSFDCVVVNNSNTQAATGLAMPPDGETHQYAIAVSSDRVEFWIDNILVAAFPSALSDDSSIRPGSAPIVIRQYATVGPGAVSRIEVSEISVQVHGNTMFRDQADASSYAGGNINTGQTGFATLTSQGNYVNSTVPATVTPSNTAAGYSTLGGNFLFAAPAGAETDLILFAFQVPAGSTTTAAKTLHMTGINIETLNVGAAVATTAHVLQWYIGFGSTAATLATADGAGTLATRRLGIGTQSFPVGAAIGAQAGTVRHTFDTPITVRPGQFLHVIVRIPVGTATASQQLRGVVGINGYYL